MRKLFASIIKDFRLLLRDKVGLAFMFLMPVILVIVITTVQNSGFQLLNENQITLLLQDNDNSKTATQFVDAISAMGMFKIVNEKIDDVPFEKKMKNSDAMIAVSIPAGFGNEISIRSESIASKALEEFDVPQNEKSDKKGAVSSSLKIYFHPLLQESYRHSIRSAISSALKIVENKNVLNQLYFSIHRKELPADFEERLMSDAIEIEEIFSSDSSAKIPNATQHNIPAWTIFAMFFIVISLAGNIVREKISGSFIRLKTMPTPFFLALVSKQLTYLFITLLQALIIFTIGIFVFPKLDLPQLHLPQNIFSLWIITLLIGLCAVNYAITVGIFAKTQEQANGFGAVSVVILAALGGIFVPAFMMPENFRLLLNISPLYWSLEAYYPIFLQNENSIDTFLNMLPLLGIIAVLQLLTLLGLKRQNLL